jgi:demethylmenaquinone methyltransferase/2-methoxy-6-polyprenyl-1,4-benzoquinol methylase
MKEYYERRAAEYDATSYEEFHAGEDGADLERLEAAVAALPPARVLDVACGTGYLTRLLRGEVVAVDQSESMLAIAATRLPGAELVRGDVPPLPFADDTFDRVFTGSFYSHLDVLADREAVLAEARRVAPELVVVEQVRRPGMPREAWEDRPLADGTHWRVFKRYLTAAELAAELGGEVLLDTPAFAMVRARR